MPEFTDRLLRCARDLCAHDPELTTLVDGYAQSFAEPAVVTRTIALSEYPSPAPPQWERDRMIILEMIHEECGEDLSGNLEYPAYMTARMRGRILVTSVTGGVGVGCINVVPIPLEEVESRDDLAFMLFSCGNNARMCDATWLVRIVRERMTDAWTGFALTSSIAFVHALITDDAAARTPGYLSAADAFRDAPNPTCRLALKAMTSETSRLLIAHLFPDNSLNAIPYGLVHNDEAILAYKELALTDLAQRIGLPSHAAEAYLRDLIVGEATIAQCVGIRRLPTVLAHLLNSP